VQGRVTPAAPAAAAATAVAASAASASGDFVVQVGAVSDRPARSNISSV
jgi:rare lipoprotein A